MSWRDELFDAAPFQMGMSPADPSRAQQLHRALAHLESLQRINSRLRALPRSSAGDVSLKLNEELIAITHTEIRRLRAEVGVSDQRSIAS